MEVKANINIDAAQRVIVNQTRVQPPQSQTDTASFRRSEALNHALQATPAARPEAVARARELISDVLYPPADTIEGIAALLALNMAESKHTSENQA